MSDNYQKLLSIIAKQMKKSGKRKTIKKRGKAIKRKRKPVKRKGKSYVDGYNKTNTTVKYKKDNDAYTSKERLELIDNYYRNLYDNYLPQKDLIEDFNELYKGKKNVLSSELYKRNLQTSEINNIISKNKLLNEILRKRKLDEISNKIKSDVIREQNKIQQEVNKRRKDEEIARLNNIFANKKDLINYLHKEMPKQYKSYKSVLDSDNLKIKQEYYNKLAKVDPNFKIMNEKKNEVKQEEKKEEVKEEKKEINEEKKEEVKEEKKEEKKIEKKKEKKKEKKEQKINDDDPDEKKEEKKNITFNESKLKNKDDDYYEERELINNLISIFNEKGIKNVDIKPGENYYSYSSRFQKKNKPLKLGNKIKTYAGLTWNVMKGLKDIEDFKIDKVKRTFNNLR